jgi:hypothetical protein
MAQRAQEPSFIPREAALRSRSWASPAGLVGAPRSVTLSERLAPYDADTPGPRGRISFFPTPTPASSFQKSPPPKSFSQSRPSLFPRAFGLYKERTRALLIHLEPSQRPNSTRASRTLGRHYRAELCRFRRPIVTVSPC